MKDAKSELNKGYEFSEELLPIHPEYKFFSTPLSERGFQFVWISLQMPYLVYQVSVNNSRLSIKYSLGGDVAAFYLPKKIDDNTWHTATLSLNSTFI